MILSVFITVITGHDKPQPPGCLLDGRVSKKGGVAGNPVCIPEMDDAVEGLAYGNEPLYYRVW